ncbi:MAG: SDR family NAD(P)-dependent oxidoreductase [Chloroflexi bacterium]|nr:SDR family NAD(P)-dependent oxidoreductase [Chloroflexota bacterium]
MTEQSNRSLLITGGTGGLGTAVVRRLSAEYTCYVLYRSEQAWQALTEEVGASQRLHGLKADLADADAVRRSVEQIRATSGPLYGLVHLAGGFEMGSVQETTLESWNNLLTSNLTGAFTAIQAVLPQLREQNTGRIITIGSSTVAGRPGGLAGYVVSKAGLNALTEVVANELKDTRVTANILLLGSLATPPMLQHMSGEQLVPLERVADTIAFLLSDTAANISGASIPVIVTGQS